MMRLKLLILTLLISTGSIFAQDVEFNAVVSKKKVGKFEKIQVEFSINKKNAREITPPDFSEFSYLGGPNTSVSQSWVNGRSSYRKTFTYVLMPKSVGTFTIGAARIKVDGITYRSKAITITVVEGRPKSANPNDPSSLAADNIHLKLELSNGRPYVNQQIVATYYLYFKMNISSPQMLETPSYNGFWSQDFDLPKRYNIEKKYLDEELYNCIALKKVLLIPQKSGKLILEAMTLDVPVEVSTGRLDFFGHPMTRQYNHTVTTGKRTLRVRPLPSEGRPDSFTGAVGSFDFDVEASKTTVEANESITLKATVKGSGNLKLFNISKLEVPEELEAYDPKHNEKVSFGKNGMKGRISEEYILIPRYKGEYKIPALKFSYFNPWKKKYITIKGDDLIIDVTKGKRRLSSADNTSSGSHNAKSDVQLLGKDIRFIHSEAEFNETERKNFFGTLLFYLLLIIPFISIPVVLFVYHQKQRSNKDVVGSRKRKAAKVAKKMLAEASDALKSNDESGFYEAVINSMYKYLAYSLNLPQSELNKENISESLTNKGASEEQINNVMDILSQCEMARYAPSISASNKEDVYNKASDLITELEKV